MRGYLILFGSMFGAFALFLAVLTFITNIGTEPLRPAINQAKTQLGSYTLDSASIPWHIYPAIPQTTYVTYYEIMSGGHEVGHVTAVWYADQARADRAYESMRVEAELEKTVSPLAFGDRGSQSGPSPYWNASDVLFQRCKAVVHVTVQGDTRQMLLDFAQRVHSRLEGVGCS